MLNILLASSPPFENGVATSDLTTPQRRTYNDIVPIYISNPEAEELAREVAAATGETITDAVIAALRDRRDKLRKPSDSERMARLLKITAKTAAIIGGQAIDFNELSDDDGLPK